MSPNQKRAAAAAIILSPVAVCSVALGAEQGWWAGALLFVSTAAVGVAAYVLTGVVIRLLVSAAKDEAREKREEAGR